MIYSAAKMQDQVRTVVISYFCPTQLMCSYILGRSLGTSSILSLKIHLFLSTIRWPIPKRCLDVEKTPPNVEICPENLRALLGYLLLLVMVKPSHLKCSFESFYTQNICNVSS